MSCVWIDYATILRADAYSLDIVVNSHTVCGCNTVYSIRYKRKESKKPINKKRSVLDWMFLSIAVLLSAVSIFVLAYCEPF